MKKSDAEAGEAGFVVEAVIAEVGKANQNGEIFTEETLREALETFQDAIDPPGELVLEHGKLKLVIWDKEEQ